MADRTAVPLYSNLQLGRRHIRYTSFNYGCSYFRILQRIDSYRRHKILHTSKPFNFNTLKVSNFNGIPGLDKCILMCSCLGALVNTESAAASDWVPIADQVLLMASMFLTYMVGVTPAAKYFKPRMNVSEDYVATRKSTSPGSVENDDPVNFSYAWDTVKGKLIDSLAAVELEDSLGNSLNEFDQNRLKLPLCLYAIAKGPRLRLLWTLFQQLEMEVSNIGGSLDTVSMVKWLVVCGEIIQKLYQHVSVDWLEKELGIKNSNAEKEAFWRIFEESKGDETVLKNIKKSGKEDLYAELVCFLRFGSLWKDSRYDKSLFVLHGVVILEDLLITLADGMTSSYLELISVDGNISNEMNKQGLILCTLSTRELQRLRNEVVLTQWLHQNLGAVVSMYEDRFDLCTLLSQQIEKPIGTRVSKFSWWKRFLRKSKPTLPPLNYVVISHFCMPIKRTKELRALDGWRYYYSLLLELSDITMPLIRVVIRKVSDAVSFLLVCMVGRSLGLIFSGIRQSLRRK